MFNIHKYHQLPYPYVSISLKSRGPGWHVDAHEHPEFQIIFITQGTLILIHNTIDYPVRKGQLCLVPPGQTHSLRSETGYHQLGVDLAMDQDRSGLPSLLKTRIKTFAILDRSDLLGTLPELGEKLQQFSLLSQLKIASLLDMMLITSLEMMEGDNSFRTRMLALVELHLADNLSLADIAQRMSFSQTHLERLTRQEFGCSVMELFRKVKISKACSLLTISGMSMEQIAEALGFCDQAYFSRFFKQRMHVTPNQYKKANRYV